MACGWSLPVLIDAGLDPWPIDAALNRLSLTPAHLLCTHGHFDHIGSARFFQEKYGTPVHLHAADLKIARTNNFVLMAMKLDQRITLPDFTLISDGAKIALGGEPATYRHTPGHTPGSCVIAMGANLFTGDTLFARGVGLSKLPGEQPDRLRDSIIGMWGSLDGHVVHPGHGPSASGAAVKENNEPLRAFLKLASNGTDQASHGV
jgi:hydroxyacylglutathione hydrolase